MVDSKDMRYILNWARIHSSLPSHPGEQKHVSHSNNSNGLNVAFMRFHLPGFRVIFARQHLRLSKTHNQQVNLNRLREYCLGMRSQKIYQSRTISVFFCLFAAIFPCLMCDGLQFSAPDDVGRKKNGENWQGIAHPGNGTRGRVELAFLGGGVLMELLHITLRYSILRPTAVLVPNRSFGLTPKIIKAVPLIT